MTGPQAPVDRYTAVETLVSWVDDAHVAGPALWVVEGAAGLGRTTVLDRLGAAVRARVMRSSGVVWEAEHEYGVLHQLMGDSSEPPYADSFEAARAFVATLAEDLTALVMVDDAHLADVASLRALVTAVRHHPSCPLVVVLTTRSDATAAAGELIAHLDGSRLALGPMTTEEVVQTAADLDVPLTLPQAEHLARHTGGVPRYVASILTTVPPDAWTGNTPTLPAPTPILRATRERLSRLGPSARAVTEAVAVLHDPVGIATAGAVAMVEDVLQAVDEAERQGLLVVRDRTSSVALVLPDPLTRAAVKADMGPTRRAELYRVASAVVTDPTAALEYAAAATTGPDEELAARLEALAGQRAAEGAWAAAAHLYLLCTRMTSQPDRREQRLLLAVDAMIGAGDVPATVSYVAEIESFSETSMRNVVLGYLAVVRGRASEAHSRLARAWELTSARPPELAAMIAQRHVLDHLARCEGDRIVEWADRAVELVGEDHPTAVEAQAIRGLGLAGAGRTQEALESYDALLARTSHGAVGQRVRMGAGWLHLATDDLDSARTELASAVPTDFLGGSQRISLWARCWLARTYFVTGEWDRAMYVVDDGLAQAERAGMVLFAPLLHWTRTQILALRGDWDAAHVSARAGDQGPRGYAVMRVPACLGRAALAEARADYTGVLDALAPLLRPAVPADVAEPGFWPWPDVYANALVLEHRHDEADAFLKAHEQLARARGHRSSQARLGYARGRLLGARGELAAARRSFNAALDHIEALPLPYDRARISFAYGQTLRRAGKRRDADGIITAARDDYLTLGATTYVIRCERELRTGGVGAPAGVRGNEALTPGEESVANLVAQGHSNREVANELFVSVKTVQFHLTRVYAKLGISSRAELAASHARREQNVNEGGGRT